MMFSVFHQMHVSLLLSLCDLFVSLILSLFALNGSKHLAFGIKIALRCLLSSYIKSLMLMLTYSQKTMQWAKQLQLYQETPYQP